MLSQSSSHKKDTALTLFKSSGDKIKQCTKIFQSSPHRKGTILMLFQSSLDRKGTALTIFQLSPGRKDSSDIVSMIPRQKKMAQA